MNQHEQIAKSRLGRLLVNRGYITEEQLSEALTIQAQQGIMLGEALLSQGLITEKDLNRTLKQQKRYRYTAAFVALAATPFQPMLALAASPIGLPVTNHKVELSNVDMGSLGGLKALDDEELAGVNAQGFIPGVSIGITKNGDAATAGLRHKYREDYEDDDQNEELIAYEMADTVLTMAGVGPISNLIDAKITIDGIKYQEGRAAMEFLEGGKMKFYMPTEIARISMEDMRVKGNSSGPTLGSIYMSDIRFNPESNYVISAKN